MRPPDEIVTIFCERLNRPAGFSVRRTEVIGTEAVVPTKTAHKILENRG